ncbi:hypothetical protein [Agromyces aerolatus]|uniref:hypothetical protein n=1 Tax=Agromyces sp. LY-1074 TaxID=3074080 RepID=UPI0028591AB2|nr:MULTISPECIES: hypothetical protein [unclassified Agromyces]MDR5698310.1 hypothetical protein [Agromyces sp. LY-1074]MDR5704604.1 hypothetical protein [Agromyces sp. LY-1358]
MKAEIRSFAACVAAAAVCVCATLGAVSPASAAARVQPHEPSESGHVAASPRVDEYVIVDGEVPVGESVLIPPFTCPSETPYILDGDHESSFNVFKGVDVEVPFGVTLSLWYSGITDDDPLDGVSRLRGWGVDWGNQITNVIHFYSARVKVTVHCTSNPADASRGK